MDNNQLTLISVAELLTYSFYIPDYQRGYRWSDKEVKDLLKDLREFLEMSSKDEFYCLQPIVVAERSPNEWTVIDGQQRLTTILIILQYYNTRLAPQFQKELYSIAYQTREDSTKFINNINQINEEEMLDNIDLYFMKKAYDVIVEWFADYQNIINDFESILLNKTKFIWYEIDNDKEGSETFTRINMGKIPLTNAELVKALFLRSQNFKDYSPEAVKLKQLEIATYWDFIENQLQDNEFWGFLFHSDRIFDTRIEYILDMISGRSIHSDDFQTFIFFQEEINRIREEGRNAVLELWLLIKRYFMKLQEWYFNKKLYHEIGYLLITNHPLKPLLENSFEMDQSLFRDYIRKEIALSINKVDLDKLFYGNDFVRRVLLLFNIATIVSSSDSIIRFSFYHFKEDRWDIEHIRSQTDEIPKKEKKRIQWLKEVQSYLEGYAISITDNEDLSDEVDFLNRIKVYLENNKEEREVFEELYNEIVNFYQKGDFQDYEDHISNLTLLDLGTNRSYGNSIFPIKRQRIIDNDKNGLFVPVCTKNVILKYYSHSPKNMIFWESEDSDRYLSALQEKLNYYLKYS